MPSDVAILDAKARLSPLWWLKRHAAPAVPARYAPYHKQLVTMPGPGESQLRAVFRGAAKTTVVRGMVVHAAIHRLARGILIVAATYGKAKEHRQALEKWARMTGHAVYSDSEQSLLVINQVPIWAHTPGGAVRGINWTNPDTGEVVRPNWCIVDDLETRESAHSQEQTDKRQEWLFSDALATDESAHPMATVMLGTPISPSSIVARAMRREEPFDTWLEPLIVPYESELGKPAWPGQYDPTRRARTPEITMATEYDMQPLPPGTLLFPVERTRWVEQPASPKWPVVVGVDPAGEGNDATVAVASTITPRGLHVVDALVWEGSSDEAPGAVASFVKGVQASGWSVQTILVEQVGLSIYFTKELRRLFGGGVNAEQPKGSKVERALPLTVWHKAGAVSMAAHLKGTRFDLEVHSFTQSGQTVTGHDDCPDGWVWSAAPLTNGWQLAPPVAA